MKCDRCGNNEAEFNYIEIERDGTRKEHHLCRECAIEMGILKDISHDRLEEKEALTVSDCPTCGMNFEEFRKNGLFGCADCYDAFRPGLYTYFREIQGTERYRGKILEQDEKILTIKKNLRMLKKKLQKYVEEENYEEAIKIRDQIEKFEEDLKSYGKK